MRQRFHCRRCRTEIGYSSQAQTQSLREARRSFVIPGSEPRYAPDLPFKLEHLKLECEVDPATRTLKGRATQLLRAISPEQTRIRFDQIGLEIGQASVNGVKARFSVQGDALWVDLPEASRNPGPGDAVEVVIEYSVKDPKRGLYFTGPDADYPKKPVQIWSQGQDEDNRWWIPLPDYPNQKFTLEMIATVPSRFTAVSNGALLSKKDEAGKTTYHYRLGMPLVSYLITLVVAEFSAWEDAGPRGLPVQYFVQPGREADGKRAFSRTPAMIAAFEKATGIDYPYEKYSQVAVQDFIFGGMENTSATTQTDRTLHDERAHLDHSSEPLVAHELAHQWFGDLITCRDWSHGWLNEGFATFMERVWIEANVERYGNAANAWEEAKYYSYMDLKEYQEDDTRKYRRAIVCNTYVEPMDLFDTHLYQKGGLVLNLMRAQLGEKLFWKAIHGYVNRHRGGSVETLDLIRAIEETTGRNLRKFFDQWVFSAGFPEYEITYQWHEDTKQVELVVEQKQTGGLPELVKEGSTTPLFDLNVRIEMTLEGAEKRSQVVRVSEARERIFLSAPSKPLSFRFDPEGTIPKTLKFPRPKEMLLHQLTHDADCLGRIEAAQELGRIADASVVEALGRQLKDDPFWAAQAEIAAVLGSVPSISARNFLIASLGIPHPKARRAVVQALASFKDEETARALEPLAREDASYSVEAEAILTWAQVRARPGVSPRAQEVDATEKLLMECLSRESYLELIRAAALRGLGELPGIARGERPAALDTLFEWTRRGKPEDARIAAIVALGKVGRQAIPSVKGRVLEVFAHLAEEEGFRLRLRLAAAIGDSALPEGAAILERIQSLDLDGRVKRFAGSVKDALLSAGGIPESVVHLKEQITRLEEEHRKLRSVVEELRARS